MLHLKNAEKTSKETGMLRIKNVIISALLITLVLCNYLAGQKPLDTRQKVYRYCYEINSKDWYLNQQVLWKTEISNNPKNEDAWFCYYFAARYGSMGTDANVRSQLLSSIVTEAEKAIPSSYLIPYLKYYNGERKIELLEKAYQLKPDCTDLYWEFIQYYDTEGRKELKKEFCEKLYAGKQIIPGLFDYSFNILNSMKNNSFLFTSGDNDIFPVWILQEAKGIRTDITVLNAHAIFVLKDLLKMKFREKGIDIDFDNLPKQDISVFLRELITSVTKKYPDVTFYFAPTIDEESVRGVMNKLLYTGLVSEYSEIEFDNSVLIQKNLEHNFKLDYLDYEWHIEHHISRAILNGFNTNYIPGFMKLSKMYSSSGKADLAKYWKDKALMLAIKANDNDLLKQIEEGKF